MGKNKRTIRIIIPCRFAYVYCWRPNAQFGGSQKYSISAVISKDDKETIRNIENAIEYVKENSVDKWGGKIPNKLHLPLHDGDEDKPDNPIYKNSYFINAKSKEAPQVVDKNVLPILDQTEVYSGCYGNVSIIFYPYSYGGSKGIAAWLGNIQKTHDGEPFGGKVLAKDEFFSVDQDDFLE